MLAATKTRGARRCKRGSGSAKEAVLCWCCLGNAWEGGSKVVERVFVYNFLGGRKAICLVIGDDTGKVLVWLWW